MIGDKGQKPKLPGKTLYYKYKLERHINDTATIYTGSALGKTGNCPGAVPRVFTRRKTAGFHLLLLGTKDHRSDGYSLYIPGGSRWLHGYIL